MGISQPFTRWRAQVCESYLILVSAAAPILNSLQKKTSKNGAPTRISEPMAEQWIDPTAREIKVGEVKHLRLDATAAPLFIIFESKDKAE